MNLSSKLNSAFFDTHIYFCQEYFCWGHISTFWKLWTKTLKLWCKDWKMLSHKQDFILHPSYYSASYQFSLKLTKSLNSNVQYVRNELRERSYFGVSETKMAGRVSRRPFCLLPSGLSANKHQRHLLMSIVTSVTLQSASSFSHNGSLTESAL